MGRATECAALDRMIAAVRAGESRVLVVQGDPGVGKSALLQYARDEAADFQVLQAVGIESEMELAFATLHQLCVPLLDRVDRLPAPQCAALQTVFGMRDGSPPDRFLVGLAVLSLISEVSAEQSLLCLIDDAQWMDRASAQVLGFVARRLLAESVGLLFAARRRGPDLQALPGLEVSGLRAAEAHALLRSALPARLDQHIRDRIVAETKGNPLALLELPRGLSATQMAGGFGLLHPDALPGRIEDSFLTRIRGLPSATRLLLLIAAAEPIGDPRLLWRAAARLGIDPATALAGLTDDLVAVEQRVTFRHPLVRSAVYRTADPAERRAVHRALADATDPSEAPDRRAWHLASATIGPDEEVAAELERSAGRAQARGGVAAAAAFLQRAVALTGDSSARADRAVTAADVSLQAGDFEVAQELADLADREAHTEVQRARAHLVRSRIAASSGSPGSPRLLLAAAQRLEPYDMELARETYLLAWAGAAMSEPDRDTLLAVSRAIRTLPVSDRPPRLLDQFLDGAAKLVVEGWPAGVPVLREAMAGLADSPGIHLLRWGWAANAIISAVWDERTMGRINRRAVEVVREAGALAELPFCLASVGTVLAMTGDFAGASDVVAQADIVAAATGQQLAPSVEVQLSALRGRENESERLIAVLIEEGRASGRLMGVMVAEWAAAVLYNGLGRYSDALPRAAECAREAGPFVAAWVLPEVVEAAVRLDQHETARAALTELTVVAQSCGTDWALGVLARSRALLTTGPAAADDYLEAIERLSRTGMRPEQARAYLLHGEWLRRHQRREEARKQLRTAYEMLVTVGMEAFAERAQRELRATGETVRRRTAEAATDAELTPQERQIALLVRDGFSNPEIGERLFLSPRTIEWHLRKVFAKLGISSRRQLRDVLSNAETVVN